MAKIYLVDSENVGASWSQLLPFMSDEDKMFVFYTDKSPYISYENLLQVIAHCGIPVFIKCHEGKNALDFQLVSELGYKLCQTPEAEFIVVSDDFGYDPAVRYWSERKYHVRRIGKKHCRPLPFKRKEDVPVQVTETEQVQNVAEEPVIETMVQPAEVIPEDLPFREESSCEEELLWKESAMTWEHENYEEQCNREPDERERVQEPDIQEQSIQNQEQRDQEQRGKEQNSLKENQPRRQARDRRRKRKRETGNDQEAVTETQNRNEPSEEAAAVQERMAVPVPEKEETVVSEPDEAPEASKEPETIEWTADLMDVELTAAELTAAEQIDAEVTAAEQTTAEELPAVEEANREEIFSGEEDPLTDRLSALTQKCGSTQPAQDAACVKELFCTLSMSNLTTVNTALKILIGNETGNSIYREVKELKDCREQLDELYYPAQKDRFLHYVQIVLDRSGLEGVTAEEIGKFLLRIPRKNLNSIRSNMLKEFGHELGSAIYTVYKPHIKVLNKI